MFFLLINCRYYNDMYIKYEISCPTDYDTAFFNFTLFNLEPETCEIPGDNKKKYGNYTLYYDYRCQLTYLLFNNPVSKVCGLCQSHEKWRLY